MNQRLLPDVLKPLSNCHLIVSDWVLDARLFSFHLQQLHEKAVTTVDVSLTTVDVSFAII